MSRGDKAKWRFDPPCTQGLSVSFKGIAREYPFYILIYMNFYISFLFILFYLFSSKIIIDI